jgi:protein-tyrosine phosphatase
VRQLAEADAEYYSVHALKSESKNKTATPPSKEAEQSILDKTLNKRINQLEIANSRNHNTYSNAEFRNNNHGLCFHCNSPDHMIKNCPRRQGQFNRTNSQLQGNFKTSI